MAKKKKKQMRETLYCPYCKRPGVLRPAAYVYGDNNLDPEKYLYVCSGYPSCDSYIGAHKKSMRPMGTMADSNLRNKRIEAHRALDAIWKNGYMTKHSTYIGGFLHPQRDSTMSRFLQQRLAELLSLVIGKSQGRTLPKI